MSTKSPEILEILLDLDFRVCAEINELDWFVMETTASHVECFNIIDGLDMFEYGEVDLFYVPRTVIKWE
jgi:hypothetical protein